MKKPREANRDVNESEFQACFKSLTSIDGCKNSGQMTVVMNDGRRYSILYTRVPARSKKPCAPTATTTEKAHPPQAILSFSAARSSKASE